MGPDGVICGHIHSAAIKQIGGVAYLNSGDWVDSCTAIVEHYDGRMELLDWGHSDARPAPVALPAEPASALPPIESTGALDSAESTTRTA
jgi:hypothetical protein